MRFKLSCSILTIFIKIAQYISIFKSLVLSCLCNRGFPGSSKVKNTAANAGDVDSVLGWGRYPGEGNGHPLQYSCLGIPMKRGALWATVHRVTERPSNTTLPLNYNSKFMLTTVHNKPKLCKLYHFHEVHALLPWKLEKLLFLDNFILEISFLFPHICLF